MRIDPRHLDCLLAIAREGSFTAAAAKRSMTQPALSQTISALERQVGQPVLERGRHGARLTSFGEMLIRHAEAIEAQLGQAEIEIDLAREGVAGPLRIAVSPVTAIDLVPRALSRLVQPGRHIIGLVDDGHYDENIALLEANKIDVYVGALGIHTVPHDIVEEVLFRDPLCVIARIEHPLASRQSVSLGDLTDCQWVLPAASSDFRRHIEALFRTAGVGWPVSHVSSDSMMVTMGLVRHCDAIAVMPYRMAGLEAQAGVIRRIPLAGIGRSRPIGLRWCRDRKLSPLAQEFLTAIRETAAESDAYDKQASLKPDAD